MEPHKTEYWLNSRDPDLDEKARDICKLYVGAPQLYQQGRLVIFCDEKTGMQILKHKHVFHFTPKHGSWLNQVELWFGVLQRRFLTRAEFTSATEFEQRLTAYLEDYNENFAHPYRWTYTRQPLVRSTPFERTRGL